MARRRQAQSISATALANLDIAGDPEGCPGPDTPEFQLRACKKIAALTKVIFTVHSSNEEHRYELDCLKYEHAKELRDARANARRELEGALSQFDQTKKSLKRKESELVSANENLHEQVKISCAERRSVEDDFTKFRSDVERRRKEEREEYERQARTASEDAERREKAHCLALADLNALLEAEKQRRQRDIEEERSRAARERENFASQLEAAHDEAKTQMEEMRKRLAEEAIATVRAQQEEKSDVEARRRELEEKVLLTDKRCVELEEKCVSLQQSEGMLSDRLVLGEKEKERLLSEHHEAVSDFERKLREAEESSIKLKTKLAEEVSRAADMDAAFKESEQLHREHSDLLAKLCAVETKSEQASAEVMKLSAELSDAQADRVVLRNQCEKLEAQLDSANQRSKELESVNEKLRTAQTETSSEQKTRLKDMQTENFRLRNHMQQLRAQYARELEAIQAEAGSAENNWKLQHARELKELREQHKTELAKVRRDLEAQFSKRLSESSETISSQMKSLEEKHKHELDELQRKLEAGESEAGDLRKRLDNLQNELEKSHAGLGSSERQLTDLTTARDSLQNELVAVKSKLEGAKKSNTALQLCLNAEKQQHEEKIDELRKSFKTESAEMKKKLDAVWLTRLKEECESISVELRAELKDQKSVALQQLTKRHEEEREKVEKKLLEEKEELAKQLTGSRQHLSEAQASSQELEKEKQLLAGKLAELTSRAKAKAAAAEDEQQKLKEQHMLAIEELKKAHDERRKNALTELKQEHAKLVQDINLKTQLSIDLQKASLIEKHGAEVEKMTAERRQEIEGVRRTLWHEKEQALDNKEKEHKKALLSLKTDIDVLKSKHAEKVALLNEDIGRLRDLVTVRSKDVKRLEAERGELQTKGGELERLLQQKEKELVTSQERAAADFSDLQKSLAKENSDTVAVLRKKFAGEVLRVEEEAEDQRKKWLARFNKLQEKLAAAEERYAKRESRPEDLDHIHALNTEIQQQKKRIAELMDQKRLFGLELENREQSLRMHFQYKPVVGVLDPLAHKKPKLKKEDSQRRSSAPTVGKAKPRLVQVTSHSSDSLGQLLTPAAPPPTMRNHVAEAWVAGESTLAAPDNLPPVEPRSTSGLRASLPRRLEPLPPSPRQPHAMHQAGVVHTNGDPVEAIQL